MSRAWSGRRDETGPAPLPTGPVVSTRCVLDDRQPGRPVAGPRSQVCAAHRDRLDEMLDPDQHGQMFAKPDERRVPASIPVLYGLLPVERGRSGEHVGGAGGVFRSTPPADLGAMVQRDPRSDVGHGRDDHDRDAALSVLGTLVAIARRLDLRDVHGRAVPLPRLDGPSGIVTVTSKYRDVIGLTGAQLWASHAPRPPRPARPVHDAAAWLHARLDQLCAVDWIGDAWHDLRALHHQLRAAAGDPSPRPLGPCRKLVDADGKPWQHDPDVDRDDGPFRCGVPLYLPGQPLKGMDEPVHLPTVITCGACGGVYSRVDIVRLGRERGQQVPA